MQSKVLKKRYGVKMKKNIRVHTDIIRKNDFFQ